MLKKIKKKKTSKKVVKKSKKKKIIKLEEIKPDQIILRSRQILLFGSINEEKSCNIIKQLLTLEQLSKDPIFLWINSGGGNVYDGFSIIDTITGITSPVITIITGKACSMAGLISLAGEKRFMSKNSVWMAHDVFAYNYDYVTKLLAGADNSKELQRRVFAYLASKTKLTPKDLNKARNEELWLYPEECKEKGIIDLILN